jgi:hypothetical protein
MAVETCFFGFETKQSQQVLGKKVKKGSEDVKFQKS